MPDYMTVLDMTHDAYEPGKHQLFSLLAVEMLEQAGYVIVTKAWADRKAEGERDGCGQSSL